MRFRHCFDCGLESRSSFFVNMKFNGKLTFAVAGVGECYVWSFCSPIAIATPLYIAIVISEKLCIQAINRQNLYIGKMSTFCASKQLQIQMWLTYKICNEERSAKIPCGISSIMLLDKFLQQMKIRNLH